MKQFLTFLIFIFIGISSYSQSKIYRPSEKIAHAKLIGKTFKKITLFQRVTNKSRVNIPSEFKNYSTFILQKKSMKSFVISSPEEMSLQIPRADKPIILELVKVNITSDDFSIVEMPSGKLIKPNYEIFHYKGIVKDNPKSIAAITIFNGEISGVISLPDDVGNMVLGKLDDSNEHILYEDKDIDHLDDFVCQNKEEHNRPIENKKIRKAVHQSRNTNKCPEIFFDIGNDIVRDKGGSQAASRFIQSVFNQVAILYDNENVEIKLSGIRAWTTSTPFSNTLNSYRDYRVSNGFNGDLAHFVTYDFSGGLAWVNGVCRTRNSYGVSGIRSSYENVPRYSWTVAVIAHELGHNFGSHHTHRCIWNGNDTAIDGCYETTGNCARPGIPSDGGTIMSYCHLTSVGKNLSKGFGDQPGDVIRSTINNASCIDSCSSGGGNGDDNGGGNNGEVNCTGIANWASGISYTVGDKVINRGHLFERTSSGWKDLGECGDATSTDLCDTAPAFVSGVSYPLGEIVLFSNSLYERTKDGWDFIRRCGTSASLNPCSEVKSWSKNKDYDYGAKVSYEGRVYKKEDYWIEVDLCDNGLQSLPKVLQNNKESILKTYPNPTREYLNLELQNVNNKKTGVTIYDIKGKEVLSKEFENISPSGSMKETLDIRTLSSGVYFIQIINGDFRMTKKIKKKN